MTAENQPEEPLGLARPIGPRRRRSGGLKTFFTYVVALGVGLAIVGAVVIAGTQTTAHRPAPVGFPSAQAAESCLKDRDLMCAEADFRAYLDKYPDDPHANAMLAMTLTEDGQHKEALPYYRKAESLGVGTYDFYASYATSLENTGQIDQAIEKNYAALRIVPSLVDVRGSLANELVRKGRAQEAVNLLETFDRSLVDRGEPPYFSAQIDQIKAKMGGAAAQEAQASTQAATSSVGGVVDVKTANGATQTIIPLQSFHGILVVPVVVDGDETLQFVVDSGASDVTIPESVARDLMRKGKLGRGDYLGSAAAKLADGSVVPSRLFNLHSLKIGDHVLHNVTASITGDRGVPLLGQSFLRRFKSWSIDNRRRVLMLQE